ncbi:MAG: DUF4250 domain-containing protein [Lachnospiraceae bacterium]|nr:DUF4250 domain-containing protein [Lachnospiraceae bacterium]
MADLGQAPKDPAMLLCYVNLKLRDYYNSPEELCKAEDIDYDVLTATLASIDYHYDKTTNQFK